MTSDHAGATQGHICKVRGWLQRGCPQGRHVAAAFSMPGLHCMPIGFELLHRLCGGTVEGAEPRHLRAGLRAGTSDRVRNSPGSAPARGRQPAGADGAAGGGRGGHRAGSRSPASCREENGNWGERGRSRAWLSEATAPRGAAPPDPAPPGSSCVPSSLQCARPVPCCGSQDTQGPNAASRAAFLQESWQHQCAAAPGSAA